MKKYLKTDIFLTFILALLVITFYKIINMKSVEYIAWLSFIIEFVVFSAVFIIIHLDIDFSTMLISANRRINKLENENKELNIIVNSITKSLLLLSEANSNIGGFTPKHGEILKSYINDIKEYIPFNISDIVAKDINK